MDKSIEQKIAEIEKQTRVYMSPVDEKKIRQLAFPLISRNLSCLFNSKGIDDLADHVSSGHVFLLEKIFAFKEVYGPRFNPGYVIELFRNILAFPGEKKYEFFDQLIAIEKPLKWFQSYLQNPLPKVQKNKSELSVIKKYRSYFNKTFNWLHKKFKESWYIYDDNAYKPQSKQYYELEESIDFLLKFIKAAGSSKFRNELQIGKFVLQTMEPKKNWNIIPVLEYNKCKTTDEFVECVKIQVPDYLILKRLGQGAIKKAYLARNIHSKDESVLLMIDPTSKGFKHYANIHQEKTINELKRKIYEEEFSAVKLRDLVDKRYIGIVSPPFSGKNADGKEVFFLETTKYKQTLEDLLQKKRWNEVYNPFEFIQQMAFALHNCHQEGIVHKDFKPDNIGITAKGNIVLCDFGCTSMFSETANSRYQYPLILRPPELAYSDEYWEKKGVRWQSDLITRAANVWTLGLIAYRMFMGKNLFSIEGKRAIPSSKEYHEQNRAIYEQIHGLFKSDSKLPISKVLEDLKKVHPNAAKIAEVCLQEKPEKRAYVLPLVEKFAEECEPFGEPPEDNENIEMNPF